MAQSTSPWLMVNGFQMRPDADPQMFSLSVSSVCDR